MNEESLRRLIREEVEAALDEADKKSKAPPKTFADFRKLVGAAAKKAKAPKDFVEEIVDVGVEGGGVPEALWGAWRNVELELKDQSDPTDQWETLAYYVHDAIIDAVGEYENAWNYAPGAKKGQKPVDASALAKAVQDAVAAMGPQRPKAPKAVVPDSVNAMSLAQKIGDDLKSEGSDVKVSGYPGSENLEASVFAKQDTDVEQVVGYLDEFLTKKLGAKFLRVDGRVHEYEILAKGGSAYIQVIPDVDRGGEVQVRIFSDEDKSTAG